METALTFDDVTLVPHFSNVASRNDTCLKTNLTKKTQIDLPIICANMDTTIGDEMAEELLSNGIFPIFHRFTMLEQQKNWVKKYKNKCFISCGLGKLDETVQLLKLGAIGVCIDIAHGHTKNMISMIKAIKKHCPDAHLIKLGTMGEYGTPNIDIEEGWLNIEHNGRKDKVLYPKKPGSFYHLSKVHDSANIEFACRIWGLRCTDLNQGFVYGISTKEIDLDYENLATSFHYDSIFGTVINRFISQIASNIDMSVYGKGTQKRAFLNLIDTINCVKIAANNEPKNGEFRVFNQFTEFSSLNEMANKIKLFADENKIKAKIKHVKNPRIEEESHYYNPKNTSLISLGLKPVLFDNEQIKKIFKIVKKNINRINIDSLEPKIKWKS